jgi:hypothetical protein
MGQFFSQKEPFYFTQHPFFLGGQVAKFGFHGVAKNIEEFF